MTKYQEVLTFIAIILTHSHLIHSFNLHPMCSDVFSPSITPNLHPFIRRPLSSLHSTPPHKSQGVAKTGSTGAVQVSDTAQDLGLSLGAPTGRPTGGHYLTKGGVQITADVTPLKFSMDKKDQAGSAYAIEELITSLDSSLGVLLQSSYEFPGRYSRWSLGFTDPPLSLTGSGRNAEIRALNERGMVMLEAARVAMYKLKDSKEVIEVEESRSENEWQSPSDLSNNLIKVKVAGIPPPGTFDEEDRSRLPSLFTVVRAIREEFGYKSPDGQLGLYGSFGYDLTFQFEPINFKNPRPSTQRDLVLFVPDQVTVVDQDKRDAWVIQYDFNVGGRSTQGMGRTGRKEEYGGGEFEKRDTPEGQFADAVDKAKREFAVGNLFEAVISQTFRESLDESNPPSKLFRRLRKRNPSPYGFLMNLGEQEYLVGASPEMFVRVEEVDNPDLKRKALRVETCPISGTVARGADALEDAKNIQAILSNEKEESELTMCTDVDRNDKSRICEAGTVKVIGRRQIEMYSRLIHTVDHVEGYLRREFDALDAFLGHTWSVTVCGSPKAWATQFVEDTEKSTRAWYGGAVGLVGFDGGLNTGLTLRTIRVKDGIAEIRAGATLLYDSNPIAEELETELKASAIIDAVVNSGGKEDEDQGGSVVIKGENVGEGKKIVIVDHQDSFVHTLSNYFRQTGAEVKTLRSGPETLKYLETEETNIDLVVLSPGPGNPDDFGLKDTMDTLTRLKLPAFGVCLGLQGMVEYFGGTLSVLGYPMHGKPSAITLQGSGGGLFESLPSTFDVARYHSLHGTRSKMPEDLDVTALTGDGIVMGIQHKKLPSPQYSSTQRASSRALLMDWPSLRTRLER
eukprot:CAMPEP_0118646544 /NCGR_PEP_ID=MMETSP0785-20121206/8119_1 /TAXON_ID=91992 /ORGANISM="Bolidomonas pacifica, Strain CCMP 1866" /LENGTH=850 /DNA_ID=CAMNT_0006538557 /DNA_START=42 /DNA_END=2595 /DNA_ORIENTATION=-